MKTAKQLERHFKGASNHRRLSILLLLSNSEEKTLHQITKRLGCNFRTISEHTKKLVQAGLVTKQYQGREVFHTLSPYGKCFVQFSKEL